MISINIETKNGKLVKLSVEEAKEVYEALKRMYEPPLQPCPIYPTYPVYPPMTWPNPHFNPWATTEGTST